MDDVVYCRVSTHTKRIIKPAPPPGYRDRVIDWFWTLTKVMRENGMTQRALADNRSAIDDSFEIKKSDLTPDGFEFIKNYYQKWLAYLDQNGDPNNIEKMKEFITSHKAKKITKTIRSIS